jgi:glyoxylase-like metal-dependent hydrolase (beta-lactamase superfamily II)
LGLAAAAAAVAQPPNAQTAPLIEEDSRTKVSDHVYVILDEGRSFIPNVGIVVGTKATLIVDTGMGDRNGRIILGEARKLSGNTQFYLTATHFHPEHDLGANGFPADAKLLRWTGQQAEADADGATTVDRFKQFGPGLAELLNGVSFRPADVLFTDDIVVDLGGVHVQIFGVGPNHTRGDTAFFVVEDRVLFTGDTVMPVFPGASGASGSIKKWLANLDKYESLQPAAVVPAHGKLIDVSYVRRYREYLTAVQTRTAGAKRGGSTLEQAQAALAEPLAAEFPDLRPAAGAPTGRINAAIQAAYREAP